jgi:DNA adenine methylase
VIVENRDYKDIIQTYDSPDTFFYLDPPYSKAQKEWNYIANVKPEELLNVLRSIKGKFIMSYDDSVENRDLFKQFKISIVPLVYRFQKHKKHTTELLIQNF